jgi:putative transposase
MKWITATHSHRWHQAHRTVEIGHLYQGRYKSFPVQSGTHYLTLMQYVESNPRRDKLVKRSQDWPSSSLAIRTGEDKPIKLSKGPVELPKRWQTLVNGLEETATRQIETCIHRGRPLGDAKWMMKTVKELSLESSLRPPGRPKKEAK